MLIIFEKNLHFFFSIIIMPKDYQDVTISLLN